MSATDPQVVTNPPGLPAIADRVNDFAGFREALLQPLPGEQAIGAWRPVPGDLGLQVLEWWAYVADVLTFYNERHANESYLRTATRASSVANLVALLGLPARTGHRGFRSPGRTRQAEGRRGAAGDPGRHAGVERRVAGDAVADVRGGSGSQLHRPLDPRGGPAGGHLPPAGGRWHAPGAARRAHHVDQAGGPAAPGRERLRGSERRLVRDHRQCHRSNRRPGHRRREHARHAERVDVGVAIVRLAEPAPGAQLGLR